MSHKAKIRIFLTFAVACWAIIAIWAMVTHQQGSGVDPIHERIHGDIYATNETIAIFDGALSDTLKNSRGALLANPQENPKSVGEAMANLANTMSVKAIVVVAFAENSGNTPLTGLWGWQTPYGVVSVEKGRVDALKALGMKTDNQALDQCADLGMAMFYCAYYFQGVSVVPVVLDMDMRGVEISAALNGVSSLLEDTGVFVVAPPSKDQQRLFTSDLTVLASLLADSANTE